MAPRPPPKNLAATASGVELQAAILAWLAEDPTRGYAAASRYFGVPYDTVKSWGKAAKAGKPPPTPNARTASRARARERGEPIAAVAPPDAAWDPASCTDREFLAQSLREAKQNEALAAADHHGGVARQWAETALKIRMALTDLAKAEAEADAWARKAAHVDPFELVRRVIALIPVLVRVAPELCRQLIAELQAAMPRES